MTVKTPAGVGQTKTQVYAACTEVTPDANKLYQFNGVGGADLYEHFTHPGKSTVDGDKKLALKIGQMYPKNYIENLFRAATIDSITPNSGVLGGGTVVSIKGTNLTGVTAVTIGVATTAVTVINENEVRCTTGATTAGAKDVVVTDDSGTVTKVGGYTYV